MLLPSYRRLGLIVTLVSALANSSYAQINVNIINAVELTTADYLDTATVTMAGGTLTFASGVTSNAFTLGGLAAAQAGTGYNISLQNTASAAIGLSVGYNNASTLYAGVLSGLGSLYKIGTGTLILTGANTYAGGTTISFGTLQIGNNGTIGSIVGNVINNATLTFARSDNITFALTVSGTGTLIQSANSTLTLTGANTYSGGTIVNNGWIDIGASNALASSGTVYINANTGTNSAGMRLGAGFTQTIGALTFGGLDAIYNGYNAVDLYTGSTLTLGGTVTYLATNNPGPAYINSVGGGTLALGGNRIFDIGDSTALNNNSELNIYVPITGAGFSLTKTGAGRLYLTGANTYSGGTIINGGELFTVANSNNVLSSTGNVTVNTTIPGDYGKFIIGAGATQTIGTLTFGGPNATSTSTNRVYLNGAGSTLTLGGDVTYDATNNPLMAGIYGTTGTLNLGANRVFNIGDSTATTAELEIASAIAGTGFSLTKTGAGWLALTGSNTYTGGTTISAGTLELNNSTVLGDVVNNASLVVRNSADGTYAGNISGTGAVSKGYAGTLTLTGANTYSGGTTISFGTLQIGNNSTIGSITGNVINNATLTFARSDDITFANNISGTGQVVQKGGGQLSLTGANTYTGGTISNAGYISIAASNTLAASGSVYINANTSAASAGLILAAGFAQTIGALTFGGANAITTQNNSISLNTGSTLTLGGTVTYLATNNPLYGAGINGAGTLALGANRIFDIGNSTALNNNSELNIYVPITGAGFSLTKTGAGRLFLTGANTYSGGTIINGGELFTGANNTLYTTGAVTINATTSGQNATLIIGDAPDANGIYNGTANGYNQTIGSLTFGGSGANNNASNLLYLNGPQTTLTLGGDVTYDATNNPLMAGIYGTTGTLNLGANRVFNIGDSTATTAELEIASAIAGTGFSLTKTGAGWLALTGSNTYTGGTTISAGTLELNNSTVLGDVVNNASLVVRNSADGTYAGNISGTGAVSKGYAGTLTLTGNNTFSGGLTLNGPVSVSSDSNLGATSGSLEFNNEKLLTTANMTLASTRSVVLGSGIYGGFSPNYGTTLTYGGVISGSGGLYKWNSGTLTLTGASTYTGGTTIGYGKLLVTNSTGSATGSGAVVVNDGTTFGGTGVISGALIINGGGSVSPGASPGQLQVGGGTTFAGGGRYIFEINNTVGTAGTNWDLLSISGSLTISATVNTPFVLDLVSLTAGNANGALANFNSANDYSWKFVTTTTGITGFSAGAFQCNASNFTNNLNIGHFYVSQTGNDLYLNFTPVPEPTTWVLLSLGLSSVLLSLRRKSRARVVE